MRWVRVILDETWKDTDVLTKISGVTSVPDNDVPHTLDEIASYTNQQGYWNMHLYNVNQESTKNVFEQANNLANSEASIAMHLSRTPLPGNPSGTTTCPRCKGFGLV